MELKFKPIFGKFKMNKEAPKSPPALSMSSTPQVLSSSFLQNRTIEEIITKWSQDLDSHLRAFRSQALVISEVDDILIGQGRKVCGGSKCFIFLLDC